MTKRQKYSNGGGPKKVKDVFKLDYLSGSDTTAVYSGATLKPSENINVATEQRDGRNVKTTLNLNLPKQKASVAVSRSKGGSTSTRVNKDTSRFLGRDSNVSISVNRPKGGGNNIYGITYSKRI